jgi:SAM-dependent methyltransferase
MKFFSKPPQRKLNLGCGDKLLPGYINVDTSPSRKGFVPDILADLRDLPFEPNSADEVLAVHVIEHFYAWETKELLMHWLNIIAPGGKLVLECPNLLTAAQTLVQDETLASDLSEKRGQHVMWPLYGDPGWADPLMCHRWGYTPKSLICLLEECGYRNVRQEPAQFKKRDPRDMRIVGIK